eukprot:CAMPEP_0170559332 /NCGR_PEP_ID=MMETSP0211-20121228/41974_1 /TAXON_ID=311385 /ORGANISM="Pseudokeronopsis sp., Strain OXSARD2" /LENGTH=62 /DNA_ID=CAMNT_0010872249 /DNA_START=588 /DNA_END=773 /DNA_ORIENTATION=-
MRSFVGGGIQRKATKQIGDKPDEVSYSMLLRRPSLWEEEESSFSNLALDKDQNILITDHSQF